MLKNENEIILTLLVVSVICFCLRAFIQSVFSGCISVGIRDTSFY